MAVVATSLLSLAGCAEIQSHGEARDLIGRYLLDSHLIGFAILALWLDRALRAGRPSPAEGAAPAARPGVTWQSWAPALLLLATGVFLRAYRLDWYSPEVDELILAGQDLHWVDHPQQITLFQRLLYPTDTLVLWQVRLLPLVFGVLGLLAVWRYHVSRGVPRAGLYAMALLGFNLFHVRFSQHPEQYASFALAAILSCWALHRALRRDTWLSWWVYACALVFGTWTSYLWWVVIAADVVAVLWVRGLRRFPVARLGAALAICGWFTAPVLFPVLTLGRQNIASQPAPPLDQTLPWLAQATTGLWSWGAILVALLVLALALWPKPSLSYRLTTSRIVVGLLLLVGVLPVLVTTPKVRHFIPLIPIVALAVGETLSRWRGTPAFGIALALVCLGLVRAPAFVTEENYLGEGYHYFNRLGGNPLYRIGAEVAEELTDDSSDDVELHVLRSEWGSACDVYVGGLADLPFGAGRGTRDPETSWPTWSTEEGEVVCVDPGETIPEELGCFLEVSREPRDECEPAGIQEGDWFVSECCPS